jgi:hypothetical protein
MTLLKNTELIERPSIMQRRKTWIHKKKEIQMMIYVTMITQMRQVLIPRNCSLILPRKMINKTRQKVRIKNLKDSRKPTINNLKKGPVGQDILIIKKAKKTQFRAIFTTVYSVSSIPTV